MRTLIKLAIVGILLHGVWRVGTAYWDHYQFEDGVKEAAQFSRDAAEETLRQTVLSLAATHGIALPPGQVRIAREQRRIIVSGDYVRGIEVLPRYERPWRFSFHVMVYML
jgi:hypothetical protein